MSGVDEATQSPKYARAAQERLRAKIGDEHAKIKVLRYADANAYFLGCSHCQEFHHSSDGMSGALSAWHEHVASVRHQKQLVDVPARLARRGISEDDMRAIFAIRP